MVGSVSPDGVPDCARVWGPAVSDDGRRIRVSLPAHTADPLLDNVEAGSVVALSFADVVTFETYQVKGRAVAVGEPVAADRAAARKHHEAFCSRAISVGIPETVRACPYEPAHVLTIEIDRLFVQTPGVRAP